MVIATDKHTKIHICYCTEQTLKLHAGLLIHVASSEQ